MGHCVLINSKEFKTLLKATGLNPIELAADVSLWQDKNGLDSYPTKEQILGIKKGVELVFEKNSELSKIGTQQEYSKYLDSIFPNSPNKKILYHIGGKDIEKFDASMFGKGEGTNASGNGVYFQENPYEIMNGGIGTDYFYESPTPIKSMYEDGILTLAILDIKEVDKYNPTLNLPQEIVIRDVDRIHILGTIQDTEGFKNYIKGNHEYLQN